MLACYLLGFISCLVCAGFAAFRSFRVPPCDPHPVPHQVVEPTGVGRLARYQHEPELDVVELSVRFGGLEISVRGSVGAASDFVRGLSTNPPPPEASLDFQSDHGYSVVSNPLPHLLGNQFPLRGPPSVNRFLPPSAWISAGSAQLSGGKLTGAQRANRAWVAGSSAAAVLRGEIGSPDRTPAFNLGNRYWVVARCSGLRCPRVYTSSQAFFRGVGRVAGSSTVCHGFASQLGAEIYLRGHHPFGCQHATTWRMVQLWQ